MKMRQQLLADYGMVLALAVLCVYFSFATTTRQTPTGDAAARQVTEALIARGAEQVLVAGKASEEDRRFSAALVERLQAAGLSVAGEVTGAVEARQTLERLDAEGASLDAITCRSLTGWLVFDNLEQKYPQLGAPDLVQPQPYYWPNFLKRDNLLNIMHQIAVIGIIAIGMTMVIITGGIDLSVGSLIALAAVVSALCVSWLGGADASTWQVVLGCGAAIVLCGLIGAQTGIWVTQFDIPSFIVTLAVMLIARGLAYQSSGGRSIGDVPASFAWLGGGSWFGIPNIVLIMFVLYVAAHLLMTRTTLGRYIYAVGGNEEAARLSGVPVKTTKMFVYSLTGLLAGLGGVALASKLQSGAPTYGVMQELKVIAAVVVGGTSLSGGEGRIFGTLIGVFIIAVIENGMNLTNVGTYSQDIVLGSIILAAVLFDRLRQKRWFGRSAS